MQKRYIAIVILCFFLFSMIAVIGSPFAATQKTIYPNKINEFSSGDYLLYLNWPSNTGTSGFTGYILYSQFVNNPNVVIKIVSDAPVSVDNASNGDLKTFPSNNSTEIELSYDYFQSIGWTDSSTSAWGLNVPDGATATVIVSHKEDTTPKAYFNNSTQSITSTTANEKVMLCLENGMPLTANYLMAHPEISLNFTYDNMHSLYLGTSLYLAQMGYGSATINGSMFEQDYASIPTNAKWDNPLYVSCYKTGYLTIFNYSLGVVEDIPEETDPTDPTDPDHGGSGTDIEEDDNSGLISGIVDGIGGFFEWIWDKISAFFTELFKPITDFITQWKERLEKQDNVGTTLLESLNVLWEKLMGYTMTPILDFFDDVLNAEAIALVMTFWEIPILKEFTLAAVAVLVISGLFILLTTL